MLTEREEFEFIYDRCFEHHKLLSDAILEYYIVLTNSDSWRKWKHVKESFKMNGKSLDSLEVSEVHVKMIMEQMKKMEEFKNMRSLEHRKNY